MKGFLKKHHQLTAVNESPIQPFLWQSSDYIPKKYNHPFNNNPCSLRTSTEYVKIQAHMNTVGKIQDLFHNYFPNRKLSLLNFGILFIAWNEQKFIINTLFTIFLFYERLFFTVLKYNNVYKLAQNSVLKYLMSVLFWRLLDDKLFRKLCTDRLLMSFNGQNKYELISDLLKTTTPIQW